MDVDGNVDQLEQETVPEQEAREELERLLSDSRFRATDRNKAFLRFISDEYFNGRASMVKAYTIAVDVFGRSCSFDAATDPIVRIEATRLRAALAQYYDSHAEPDCVRIALPRGRYVPIFTKSAIGNEVDVAEEDAVAATATRPPGMIRVMFKRRLLFSGVAVLAVAAIGLFLSSEPVAFTAKPAVTLEMKASGEAMDAESELLLDNLVAALSQFQTLKLSVASAPVANTAIIANTTAPTLIWSTPRAANAYHLVLKYRLSGGARSVWWQVTDPATGEALRTGVEKVSLDEGEQGGISQKLVSQLAVRFGSMAGVINGLELARELAAPTKGNGCVLRSVWAVERRDSVALSDASRCLQATLRTTPDDPDVNAQLAIVLLEIMGSADGHDSTTRALELAEKAVTLAPMSDRAAYARMMAQFVSGRTEAAIASGYRAMALNPNNSAIPARLGMIVYAAGRWAEGTGLAVKADMIDGYNRAEAELTLALDAYRRGEFAQALLRVQKIGRSQSYVGDILELAAAGQTNNAAIIRETTARLSARQGNFQAMFRSEMTSRHYRPELIRQLEEGLQKAAATIPEPVAELSAN